MEKDERFGEKLPLLALFAAKNKGFLGGYKKPSKRDTRKQISKGRVKCSSWCDCSGRSHLFHYQAIERVIPKGMEFPLEFHVERRNRLGPYTKPEGGFVSQKGLQAALNSL